VIGPSGAVRVMVATRPVDFRKGAEGLSALVREIMAADPFSGTVYVFRAKRADRIKLVFWDGTGLCLFAKRLEDGYLPGERAMLKVKKRRTADCVVGGFRYAANAHLVGSLLLGLYNNEGKLDHVGFTATLHDLDREALTRQLEGMIMPPGFTGNAPGGPSRWSTERSGEWQPLRPELVVEVRYDHVSGGRFRHGTRFLRWRPDKAPGQCTFGQIEQTAPMA